jgi:hypothetical protein
VRRMRPLKETTGGWGLRPALPDAPIGLPIGAGQISKMRSARTIAAHLIGRVWGTPRCAQIRRRERVLGAPGDRQRDGFTGYAKCRLRRNQGAR